VAIAGQAKQLVVMISGSGSNLQAILDAIATNELNAQVTLVVSNHQSAFGLTRARNAGVPTLYFPLKPYRDAGRSREDYDTDLARAVSATHPNLIVLAGWMHIFSPAFLSHISSPVINLHPALPGTFAGTDAILRAFTAFQRNEITHTGCMVHNVVPEVDAGPVIVQTDVAFTPGETLESFEMRMHAAEHRTLVEAIHSITG
jgi:formyltetrahydrofolate-dependent phosphoribosylglycinamide formyltransferase